MEAMVYATSLVRVQGARPRSQAAGDEEAYYARPQPRVGHIVGSVTAVVAAFSLYCALLGLAGF